MLEVPIFLLSSIRSVQGMPNHVCNILLLRIPKGGMQVHSLDQSLIPLLLLFLRLQDILS